MAKNVLSISPGTVYNLKEVITKLPEDCHPDCTQLDRISNAYARPYLISYFGDEERADRYLRQRIAHFGCICFPQTPPERAQALNNLMIPVTLFDDTFSKPGIQGSIPAAKTLHDGWYEVFAGRPPSPHDNPAFLLVHESIEAAATQMTGHLARRARQAWRDMADSHLEEAVLRNNSVTLEYQQYLDKRLTNVYGWWLTTHVEFGAGIDLGDLSVHPEILAVRRAAIHHVILVNDLYSFPKELDAKEAMNAILVLMHHDGLSLQQSINEVVDRIHQAEQDFYSACNDIRRSQLGHRSDIGTYLEGLGYLMTGNLRWSQVSTRYFGDQHDSSTVTSGLITITPKPTVHTPAPHNRS